MNCLFQQRQLKPGKTKLSTKNLVSNQGGYILIPVILAISLIATIALMINNDSAVNTNQVGAELESDRINYIAEAGLAYTLWRVQNNMCMGDFTITDSPFEAGQYSALVESPATNGNHYSIDSDRDTFIAEWDPNGSSNGSSHNLNIQNTESNSARALYHFDLSSIPSNARVVSATASFFINLNNADDVINVHAITQSWGENSASWNNIATQFDSAKYSVIGPVASNATRVSINLTALAQAWVNNADSNYGIMLMSPKPGNLSGLASRESNSFTAPVFEITTANGAVSPINLSTTAILNDSTGISLDLNRYVTQNGVIAYQPQSISILQPDAADGKDTKMYEKKKNWNYGVSTSLDVTNSWGFLNNSLLQFTLEIPHGAKIHKAELALHQNLSTSLGGVVEVRRLSTSWVEGDGDGSGGNVKGATWKERSDTVNWFSEGGDYNSHVYASLAVAAGLIDWYAWDITELVTGWVNGDYSNDGLALVPANNSTDVYFDSSDSADTQFRPKLTITYSCECGSPCIAPKSTGNILMIVDDPDSLSINDQHKVTQFEAWGYHLNLIDDNDSTANIATEANNNDVIYVSSSVDQEELNNKLTAITIGIISEAGLLNNELGIASGSAWSASSAINISDNSHYITSVFPAGSLQIYSSTMEQLNISGSTAPGLQQLADNSGAGALVILDTDASLGGDLIGQNAAGPRVMLPIGRENNLQWNALNNNGLLLIQRSLQWGMRSNTEEENVIAPQSLLLVVDNTAKPHHQVLEKKQLLEKWGYIVTMIAEDDDQAAFDVALANNLVVFVPSDISDSALNTKLVKATIGVVYEKARLNDEFGLAADYGTDNDASNINIKNALHYITLPFGNGLLQVNYGGTDLHYLADTQATNINLIASSTSGAALVTLNTGDALIKGGLAAGPRVKIPWGENVYALTEDARTIMRRSLEWAENGGAAPPPPPPPPKPSDDVSCLGTFRDEFSNTSYAGNNGTLSWSGDWLEINEKDGVNQGYVQVGNDPQGSWYAQPAQQLLIDNQSNGIMREVNLSGSTQAILSLLYSLRGLNKEDYISLEISAEGSSGPWKELSRFYGPSWDQTYHSFSMDISAYISSNTNIRLISAERNGKEDKMWFDDIEIECSSP